MLAVSVNNGILEFIEAHIGIGISGQEGMQAVMSSDYSLAQFRYPCNEFLFSFIKILLKEHNFLPILSLTNFQIPRTPAISSWSLGLYANVQISKLLLLQKFCFHALSLLVRYL